MLTVMMTNNCRWINIGGLVNLTNSFTAKQFSLNNIRISGFFQRISLSNYSSTTTTSTTDRISKFAIKFNSTRRVQQSNRWITNYSHVKNKQIKEMNKQQVQRFRELLFSIKRNRFSTKPDQESTTTSSTNTIKSSSSPTTSATTTTTSIGIFKRFKEAYKQHGKILIACHVLTSIGWYVGFFFLSKSGYDITSLFVLFQKLHIMTKETSDSITSKINNFNLESFLRKYYFSYILPESAIQWLGRSITGETLKHVVTSIMLYKIFTPLRYLVTLGSTKLSIELFKRRGVIPQRPPPGSSIQDLYTEQKQIIRRSIKKKKESYQKRMRRILKRTKRTP
jgi:hypothetical protein